MSIQELDSYLHSFKGKVVHQIWFRLSLKSKKLFQKFERYRNSWKINQGWGYFLWDEKTALSFISTFFPEYLKLYKKYPYAIQRIDCLRYFLLYRYGGVYADCDQECIKPFDDYILNQPSKDIFIVESANTGLGCKVSNCLMYSIPNHPFWKKIITKLKIYRKVPWFYSRHFTIMVSTGPSLLNKFFSKYIYRYKLNVFPKELFNPKGLITDKQTSEEKAINKPVNDIYSIHHGAGSWESSDSRILIFVYCNFKILLFIILTFVILFFIHSKIKKE